jgi:hypothetical protein
MPRPGLGRPDGKQLVTSGIDPAYLTNFNGQEFLFEGTDASGNFDLWFTNPLAGKGEIVSDQPASPRTEAAWETHEMSAYEESTALASGYARTIPSASPLVLLPGALVPWASKSVKLHCAL